MKYTPRALAYVNGTDLVPEDWGSWFWPRISEDAPFSWGDNSHSLVPLESFLDHCKEALSSEQYQYVARLWEDLPRDLLVDLET